MPVYEANYEKQQKKHVFRTITFRQTKQKGNTNTWPTFIGVV